MNSFWKFWNLKYKKGTKKVPVAVHGTSDPGLIANAFKDHFANSFINSHDDTRAKTEFEELCQINVSGHSEALPVIDIESIEFCIKSLGILKAAGHDGLVTEHIMSPQPCGTLKTIIHINSYSFIFT